MFPDSGDSVPAFLLPILTVRVLKLFIFHNYIILVLTFNLQKDLQFSRKRNWGAAVLGYLYRRLDVALQGLTRSIGGP
jgi:hypothetical protein